MFQGTPALQEVIIGKNVTQIGQLMFANCSNIEKIRILSPSMPNWQYGTDYSWASFNGETFTKAKLYVPCGQIATYQANENKWANFTTIVDTLIYDVTVICPHFPYFKPEHISLTTSDCNNATLTFNQDIINSYASQYQWMGWAQTENDILTNLNHISMRNVTSDRTLMAVLKPILNVGDTFSVKSSEGVAVTYKILTKTTDNMTVTVGVNDNSGPTAIDPSYTGTLTIPEKVQYFDEEYNVVQIGYYAFTQCALTGINLPNTLIKIRQDAFNKSGLTSIVIPNSVVEMESEVFIDCDNLASVTLPNTIERLNVRLFQNCDILSEITIPNSVKYLESDVFSNCESLTTIHWTPTNILRIGNNAFGTTP